jgi:leader peptidase (prepilin peptidase)/N-methyltransferase
VTRPALVGAGVVLGLALGPLLARAAARLAARDAAAASSVPRVVGFAVLLAALLAGVAALIGPRPASLAMAWLAGAGLVLGAVDVAVHRLPDRVTLPAYAVCAAGLLLDAAVLGTWPALLRGLLAAAVAFAAGCLISLVSPEALGFGDVKLLGLLGLVLGWFGWGVLLAGLFFGLVAGALISLALLVSRRAGWRTAVPFGPPLLLGAALAIALGAPAALL